MADIINLRRVRKAKARSADAVRAAENRSAFGRPKAERERLAAEQEGAARRLEGHRRETPPDES